MFINNLLKKNFYKLNHRSVYTYKMYVDDVILVFNDIEIDIVLMKSYNAIVQVVYFKWFLVFWPFKFIFSN